MIERIYSISYAIYFWSKWAFFAAVAGLFVIPFVPFNARLASWGIAFLIAAFAVIAGDLSEALCRAILRRPRPRRQLSSDDVHEIEFLKAETRAVRPETEACRAAAELHQHSVEAWWIDRQRR